MTTSDPRIMIPMIRNVMPNLIAQQITGVQPMNTYTGSSIFNSFFAKEYNKKYWPYQYVITQDSREAERWCWDRFKGRYWSNYGHRFVFKQKDDAALFVLSWV